jgi:cyclophilin family peptidyl-prolyl cis-trans isomerase
MIAVKQQYILFSNYTSGIVFMNSFFKIFFLVIAVFYWVDLPAQVKIASIPAVKPAKTKQASPQSAKNIQPLSNVPVTKIKIITHLGEIVIRLSNKTPKHRDNFIKLVKDHFYDSLLFHRIVNTFMIQGGDPKSKNALPGALLGEGDVGYTIPAEFDSTLYHKRGALCAARTDNPEKASSGCQFYIVQGKTYSDGQLDHLGVKNGVYFSPAKRMTYKMVGGTPQLDVRYTVFGEVESGIEVVDKIALSAKDSNNRPLTDIRMVMEIIE